MGLVRIAPVAVGITLASACGGDQDARLSADEFRDRAEAICREIEETDIRPPSGASDFDRYADEFTDLLDAAARDFHELEPPEELQARWQEYLEFVDDLESMVHGFIDDTQGASPEEIARLVDQFGADFPQLESRGHAIERDLGLDECVD